MRLIRHLTVSILAIGISVASAHASVILIVNASGTLTGATGVTVNGSVYDVAFVDDSCLILFNGCNELSDFTFTSEAAALAASQALLDQVFVDSALGNFDSTPSLTNGCTAISSTCVALTPFGFSGPDPAFAGASNSTLEAFDLAGSGLVGDVDTLQVGNLVYAYWTASSAPPVPEPAAMMMLATGFTGVAARRWRRRRSS
jgi:hypothetical protein